VQLDRSELRRTLEDLKGEARDLLERLIEFPSTQGREAEVVSFLEGRWAEAGFIPERRPIDDALMEDPEFSHGETDVSFADRDNLVVSSGVGDGRSVIVNAHVDVVPAGDWAEAFAPSLDGDAVIGRGACDDKGQVAVMFLAAAALRALGACPAGQVIYEMVVEEDEGVNAIDLACETIGLLYEYEKELIRDADDQPLFAHYEFPTQVNVGVLRGGEWPSMVPASAVMEGGVGFLPNRAMAQVREDLVRCIEQGGSPELKERYRLSFPKLHNDSYETPPGHPLVRTFHEATLETAAQDTITGWNVSCDARLFARLGGMPTVVFGPGRIEDAHSAGEKISMADVLTAAETLILFIERWCGLVPDA
jgi:acetylornithine deacetylase